MAGPSSTVSGCRTTVMAEPSRCSSRAAWSLPRDLLRKDFLRATSSSERGSVTSVEVLEKDHGAGHVVALVSQQLHAAHGEYGDRGKELAQPLGSASVER
jgi:hypothetical protein